ncbi:MAG: winged helix-turn-helix transcriptional regulator [Acidimicrobiales bacterium]
MTARAAARTHPDGLSTALTRVGDRWTLLIVGALLAGPRRFGQLSDELEGIAPNVLTQRLRQLEADRLIVAEPYSGRPVRYAYGLTARGAALAGALRLLTHWGAEQVVTGEEAEPTIHRACGTVAEPRWWCPTCDRALDDGELDDVRWV